MRARIIILENILSLDGDLDGLILEISKYGFDSDEELVIIQKSDILKIFDQYNNQKIPDKTIIDRANCIEGRDDFGYEILELKEVIHNLANYEINISNFREYVESYISVVK